MLINAGAADSCAGGSIPRHPSPAEASAAKPKPIVAHQERLLSL
jgi:hypothetical protein